MITPYGRSTLLWYGVCLTFVVAFVFAVDLSRGSRFAVLTAAAVLTLLVLNFFRDPERSVPAGDRLIIAPADGKIISIGRVVEPEYIRGDALQVCIFMSPLD